MSRNRYPGVKPFERSEQNIFFGRDQDIENLYELILLEKLVVLFGKSGYGKSSLLNAGILPKFEEAPRDNAEHFIPITIRFGTYIDGEKMLSPVGNVRQRLAEVVGPVENMAFVHRLMKNSSLWRDFKIRQSPDQQRFLLIFDQFEELFTYPLDQQHAFKQQLAELLYTAIPQAVRDAAEDLPDEDYDRLTERLDVKAVFAIRSDRLSALDQLKDALPAILRIRYELRPLQPEQARTSIVQPAALPADGPQSFATEPFVYTKAALDTILSNLAGSNPESRSGIEAFQLQIICQYIEQTVRQGRLADRDDAGTLQITAAQLPDMSNIYEEYYQQHIALLPEARREAARRVIEEGLLLVSAETGEARRLSVDGGALMDRYRAQGVDDTLLDDLVNAFLLRRERNSTGGFNYEISHDTLMKPIAHARQERRAEEQRLENERKRQEAEAKAQQEENRRKQAERGRRRARLLAVMAIVVALIALAVGWYALQQKQKADDAQEAAERSAAETEQQRLAAVAQKNAADSTALIAEKRRIEADSLAQLAFEEKERAERERRRAEDNFRRLNTRSEQVVDVLIEQARELIVACRYDEALAKLQDGADLMDRSYSPLGRALMELAFFYGEAGQAEQAVALGTTVARLLGESPREINAVSKDKTFDYATLERYRQALRRLLPARYDSLYRRYYPLMIPVQGGTFTMGCDTLRDNSCEEREMPPHAVSLSSFQLAQTETTVWQYSLYCAATGQDSIERTKYASWTLDGNTPVIEVSWYDAARYANWLSGQMGKDTAYTFVRQLDDNDWEVRLNPNAGEAFRLPTEAEWEFAARGGLRRDTFLYSGSDTLEKVGWCYQNADRTMPVATTLKANGLGLYDMSGNVWEWCGDWYGGNYYENSMNSQDPQGPDSGNFRVLRGGSWSDDPGYARCFNRVLNYPDYRYNGIGFRLARAVSF